VKVKSGSEKAGDRLAYSKSSPSLSRVGSSNQSASKIMQVAAFGSDLHYFLGCKISIEKENKYFPSR